MLIQSSFCSSIETTPFNVSECENSIVYDWVTRTETCQMFHKFPEHSQGSSLEAVPNTDEMEPDSFHLNHQRFCSKQSTTNKTPENAPISFVYSRRKQIGKPGGPFAVYVPGKTKRSGDCLSVISSDAVSVAEKGQDSTSRAEPDIEILEDPLTHSHVCNGEADASNPELINKFPAAQLCVSDGMLKNCMHRTRDVDSMNDSCSSSRSNFELALASMKTGADEASECSSSGVIAVEEIREDISAKDFCILILRNNGLLEGAWPARTSSSVEEDIGADSSSRCSRLCKICGGLDIALKMLICDNCGEAFHTYCCSVQMKKLPEDDEWFCPSCLKKKRKILKKTTTRKRARITGGEKCKSSLSKTEANPIALMLRDTEPYTTGVRIGKNFQAEVPDWSGPTVSDATSPIGQPLEMDPSECMHESNANKPYKVSSIGNWLQCREERVDGTICGKWRRAPLFEVQTDDWECYSCLFWDPSHADCAVPQELETDEILKQLKYIEMLRPRLAAKRQKLEATKGGGSSHSPEDTTDTV